MDTAFSRERENANIGISEGGLPGDKKNVGISRAALVEKIRGEINEIARCIELTDDYRHMIRDNPARDCESETRTVLTGGEVWSE